MMALRALLWDVDGTLAETEHDGHLPAFNRAFEEAGLPWRWDAERYGALLEVTGGRERILHDLLQRADAPPAGPERDALVAQLHRRKNHWYAQAVADGAVRLRPGVTDLIEASRAHGCLQAIVTTTSRANVEALLSVHLGDGWRQGFAAVVCGEDVQHKKPDPEAHHRARRQLGLSAQACLAIEDAPAGARAALAEGIPVVVTRSRYFAGGEPTGVTAVGPGLDTRAGWQPPLSASAPASVGWADLVHWHAGAVAGTRTTG